GVDTLGNKAEKPGFCFIASQNDISFAGRKKLSPAEENRTHKILMCDYPQPELAYIARRKRINETHSNEAATLFINSVRDGEANHISETPTFREYERYLENLIKYNPFSILPDYFYLVLINTVA